MTARKAQCTPLEKVKVLQRKLYRAAKAQPQRTFGVLYDKVCRLDVLEVAWAQVRRDRGAAGVDGETIEAIEARGALEFLLELREEAHQPRIPATTCASGIYPQTRWAAETARNSRCGGSSRAGSGCGTRAWCG